MLVTGSTRLACAARFMPRDFGQTLITFLKMRLHIICFGDVADKNIATILVILGNDNYRAWFSNTLGPGRGVKKHSETFAHEEGTR